MKPVVLFLALLAAVKLAHQEYLFRIGTRDAIVGAYKEHATEACQREARSTTPALSAQAWVNPAAIRLVIGKNTLDVNLWQVDNALWNARYRNPYLVLTAGQHSGTIYCEYDIVNAAAAVHRL
ncbi:MAG TPA: hypothetical protein VHI72_03985 [Hyphomicrobiaceae bacterium]|jgi:ATP-dependent helicase YprA (DUF1998 family)|nr:hypothetical protein [Hyphomicrobiaceae bacterium]